MKAGLLLIGLLLPMTSLAQVFRCGEPKGAVMWSQEGHKIAPDGFKGVSPVVIIDGKEMTIVWGDSKSAGGAEKVWKAIIFHQSPQMVSGVSIDADDSTGNSAAMMYSVDKVRGYLYLSSHRNVTLFNGSSAQSFVSKCSTK